MTQKDLIHIESVFNSKDISQISNLIMNLDYAPELAEDLYHQRPDLFQKYLNLSRMFE